MAQTKINTFFKHWPAIGQTLIQGSPVGQSGRIYRTFQVSTCIKTYCPTKINGFCAGLTNQPKGRAPPNLLSIVFHCEMGSCEGL